VLAGCRQPRTTRATTDYFLDGDNRVSLTVNAMQDTAAVSYKAEGDLTATQVGMWVNGVTTPTQAPTLMFYDGDHQVTLTVEPSGVAQAQWYDAVGGRAGTAHRSLTRTGRHVVARLSLRKGRFARRPAATPTARFPSASSQP
jgi:YD repeat-containing protein